MLTQSTRRRRGARWVAASLATTAALTTAACSGGDDSSSSDGGGEPGNASIALSIGAQPASLDPSLLQEGQQAYIWGSVFDTLLLQDRDGNIQPNAAESYEYSEDLRTLTLTLREGMEFTNGNPVDAEAVRATLERTRTTPGPLQERFGSVASVEAPDERTVVLNLSRPDAALLSGLTFGAGVIADPSTFEDPNLALDPVGSGPYELDDDATTAGSTYVLQRRDDYWNAEAYPFATLTVRVIQDPTAQFNALLAGEVTAGRVNPDQEQQIQAAGYAVTDLLPTAVAALLITDRDGTIAPALADERVRQAMNLAFDRQAFGDALLQGNAEPTEQLFGPSSSAYVEDLEGTYEFDPERARELMAEAGYADGFSMTLPSTVLSSTFEPSISQALSDIGIDVTWEPQPPQGSIASIQSGQYPAAFWFEALNVPAAVVQSHYSSSAIFNPLDNDFSEIEGLLEEAAATTDEGRQAELFQEIGTIAVEEALDVPISLIGTRWATAEGIDFVGDGASIQSSIRQFDVAS